MNDMCVSWTKEESVANDNTVVIVDDEDELDEARQRMLDRILSLTLEEAEHEER